MANIDTLYMRLYYDIRHRIQTGAFTVGQRLPSKRSLAQSMGVSVNTVDAAYAQLCAEGFVVSRERSGFYVCQIDELKRPEMPQKAKPEAPVSGIKTEVDFSPAGLAADLFPYATWRRLMKNAFNEYDETLLLRAPAQGDQGLRRAISAYIWNARGVQADPDSIVVGAGSSDLMQILAFILPGQWTLAVENPVYNEAYRFFEAGGHRVLPVDVDRQGIQTKPLSDLDPAVVYTTPSHQYPLGFSMPISRRIKLLNWAAAGKDRYIIEDDHDSEFRYGGRPIPSLASIDEGGRVIYMGTFSRSVTPALRIGYMVLPQPLLERYHERWQGLPAAVSSFDQRVLRDFMEGGHFERHLSRLRQRYKTRRDELTSALAPFGKSLKIVGDNAGCHLTVKLTNGMSWQEMCRRAMDKGVKVYPVSDYFIGAMDPIYESKVLLGYGGLTSEEIAQGARLLLSAWGADGR